MLVNTIVHQVIDAAMKQLQQAGVELARPATIRAILEQMDELASKLETELERL